MLLFSCHESRQKPRAEWDPFQYADSILLIKETKGEIIMLWKHPLSFKKQDNNNVQIRKGYHVWIIRYFYDVIEVTFGFFFKKKRTLQHTSFAVCALWPPSLFFRSYNHHPKGSTVGGCLVAWLSNSRKRKSAGSCAFLVFTKESTKTPEQRGFQFLLWEIEVYDGWSHRLPNTSWRKSKNHGNGKRWARFSLILKHFPFSCWNFIGDL